MYNYYISICLHCFIKLFCSLSISICLHCFVKLVYNLSNQFIVMPSLVKSLYLLHTDLLSKKFPFANMHPSWVWRGHAWNMVAFYRNKKTGECYNFGLRFGEGSIFKTKAPTQAQSFCFQRYKVFMFESCFCLIFL